MNKVVVPLSSVEALKDLRPEDKSGRKWKFIVLKDGPNLVFITGAVTEYPYHANLLATYCDQHAIPSSWAKKPDWVEVFDRGVQIRGGGYLQFDLEHRRVRVYGRSSAYGPYTSSDLTDLLPNDPVFAGYEVLFR